MNRRAEVYYGGTLAGILSEGDDHYTFCYDPTYLENDKSIAVSLTLPLQSAPFENRSLFPFFDGLIPEGWLLDIAHRSWKINARDRMGLLLACCKDCIGMVSVHPIDNERSS